MNLWGVQQFSKTRKGSRAITTTRRGCREKSRPKKETRAKSLAELYSRGSQKERTSGGSSCNLARRVVAVVVVVVVVETRASGKNIGGLITREAGRQRERLGLYYIMTQCVTASVGVKGGQ
jgi:hypothetical protein